MRAIKLSLFFALIVSAGLFSCKKDKKRTDIIVDETSPVAAFSWAGNQRIGTAMQFTNQSLYADSYKWNFGNGETSTRQTPDNVTYTAEGTYDVVLTAMKGQRKSVYKRTLLIMPDNKPAAHFSYTYKNGQTFAPATIILKNESVNGISSRWDAKGETYTQPDPELTFNTPGTYKIKLTAINGDRQAVYEEDVVITVNSNPLASFQVAYQPTPRRVNEPIQFVNQSKNADAWEWTFGTNGPAPSTDEHPEVKFTTAGNYAITLVAKKGALRSAPRTITIQIKP
jgi:PKD repeat protein